MNINNNLVGLALPIVVNRDRWQETEGDSGAAFNDVIKGTERAPKTIGGAGFTGCDVLDQRGVDRITGLGALVPPSLLTTDPTLPGGVNAISATGFCPLVGNVWGEGDILLGGAGSDTITGRGANDIIDGDRSLTVRISVRTNPADPTTETGTTDLMENKATSGSFGPGTAGMTLQQAVFAGLVDPGNLVSVREIVTAPLLPADCGTAAPVNCDTAVYQAPRSSYTIVNTAATAATATAPAVEGKITVTQTGPNGALQKVSDGVDTLRNIEAIQFTDQTVFVAVPKAPTMGTATASSSATTTGTATVSWTGPVPQPSSFTIVATPTVAPAVGTGIVTRTGVGRTLTSATIGGLVNGRTYTLQVIAVNLFGSSPPSAASNAVTPVGLPGVPTTLVVNRGNTTVFLDWNAPLSDGGSPITGYNVQVQTVVAGVLTIVRTDNLIGTATSNTETGLTNGTRYTFRIRTVNALGVSGLSATSAAATPATTPDAPGILPAASGVAGGTLTAIANWSIPPFNGGSAITGYRVSVLRMAADGVTVQTTTIFSVGATPQSREFALTSGNYRFEVKAFNSVGDSPISARSNLVAAL